jgi:YDG domain
VGNVTLVTSAATFPDANAANGKTVTVNLSLTGSAAGNYTLTQTTATTTANITALGITGSITSGNKTYDATNTATITGRSLTGVLAGDTGNVTLSGGTATFSDKNVANGKTVTGSGFSLTGTASGNYSLTSVGTTTANITAATLTVSATGVNKTYNGNTTATVTLSDNHLLSDVVTESYTGATFASKNVVTGGAVSVTGISITGGTDAGNYTLGNTTASTTANITKAPLTITALTNTKLWDGTTTAAAVPTVSGLQGTDTVTGLTETYSDANVGTGKTLSVATYTVNDGNSGGNYTVSLVANTTGVINSTDVTGLSAATQNPNGIQLTWTNPTYGTFQGVLFLRLDQTVGSTITAVPANGTTYTQGTAMPDGSEVVYDGPGTPSAGSYIDGPNNSWSGTKNHYYFYKAFSHDSTHTYSSGVATTSAVKFQ